jgi:hypothetical protein
MKLSFALRVVRASAVYDLIATALFALPWTAVLVFDVLGSLGFPGAAPTDTVFTVLFANLMGSIVLVWAVLRILRPSLMLGVADTAARVLFSANMVAALIAGASSFLIGFLVLEVWWALVQGGVIYAAFSRPKVASC